MKKYILLVIAIITAFAFMTQQPVKTPDQLYGVLFKDIQLQRIFPDGKTFVDCVPKGKPETIVAAYKKQKSKPGFSLKQFVADNFTLPAAPKTVQYVQPEKDVATHIKNLWASLKREADKPVVGSSLLPLPGAYIVPGGRFREIYYWDSYFTMLGLEESGELATIESMVDNFAYLIKAYGHVPNGNRSYYLSRSQPPFFALMVDLLAKHKGEKVYTKYQHALEKEYAYWMDQTAPTKHVVRMPNGSILNRYYDAGDAPRQESYREDHELATAQAKLVGAVNQTATYKRVCRDLRSGAESGWDFSTRWFNDNKTIGTIATTDIIPVDLNGLLYQLEIVLAKAAAQAKQIDKAKVYYKKALRRKTAIRFYCWNESMGWYYDYSISQKKQTERKTIAGASPLFFQIATDVQAPKIAHVIEQEFLKSGGVVTTLVNSGQQWDAPNGWAPLQWMTIQGLRNYQQNQLAETIAKRWIQVNTDVYARTGKMMEKYNVENTTLEAGGGEYPGQDGFGWTNGVLLKLISLYGKH